MTCNMNTVALDGDGFVVITGNRTNSGYLNGAPEHLCIYNQSPIEAEYVTPTAEAAKKLYDDALANAALNSVRIRRDRHTPKLVRVSVPSSPDYIDFWTVRRKSPPEASKRDIGNRYAQLGHPGIASELRVTPPPGADNLEICIFLTPDGLKVLQEQKITA